MKSRLLLHQKTRQNLTLAKSIQEDLDAYFFRRATRQIKSALDNIMFICNASDTSSLTDINSHALQIGRLLEDVSLYADNTAFDVRHVADNVLTILQESYRNYLNVAFEVGLQRAFAKGSQTHLEQSLLYIMIEVIEAIKELSSHKKTTMFIRLFREEREAVIKIRLTGLMFDAVIRRELLAFTNQNAVKAQLFQEEGDTEFVIRVPLSFSPANPTAESVREKKNLNFKVDLKTLESELVRMTKKATTLWPSPKQV